MKPLYSRRMLKFITLTFFILINNIPLYAAVISSTELINLAKKYDGKIVYFEGEVIGEVMKRKDIAWLNLSDSTNSCLGIFAEIWQIPKITYHGGYKAIGDTIRVKGIFHRACQTHGGELDIHALSLKIVKQGQQIQHPINITRVRIALLLSLITIILIITQIIKVNSSKDVKKQ